MNVAVISPVYNLEYSDRFSHTYMVLSWLCKEDPQYKSYFSSIKSKHDDAYVILDNGMNEGQTIDNIELVTLAYDIHANEVIAPDIYEDGVKTVQETKQFLDQYYDSYIKDKLNIMAVVQGKNEQDFMSCYNSFLCDERINILGLGYRNLKTSFQREMSLMTDNEWQKIGIKNISYLREVLEEDTFYHTLSRIYFLKTRIYLPTLKKYKKKIHLLGSYNPYEMNYYSKSFNKEDQKLIRSWDSAAPCQAAQVNVKFNKKYGVINKPKALLNFQDRLTEEEKQIVQYNLKVMEQWLNE